MQDNVTARDLKNFEKGTYFDIKIMLLYCQILNQMSSVFHSIHSFYSQKQPDLKHAKPKSVLFMDAEPFMDVDTIQDPSQLKGFF
jgi:hypothetical protein